MKSFMNQVLGKYYLFKSKIKTYKLFTVRKLYSNGAITLLIFEKIYSQSCLIKSTKLIIYELFLKINSALRI